MHTKSLNLSIRAIDNASRSVDVIASTAAIDSYEEIVEQVWDLRRYQTNPVVLFAHDSHELPIGRAENVRVEGGALRARIVFASAAANPKADGVWQLVKERMVSGVSVGFVPRQLRKEMRGGKEITVLSENELYEISIVPVPANPDAAIARASGRAPAPNEPAPDLGAMLDAAPIADPVDDLLAPVEVQPSSPEGRPEAGTELGEMLLAPQHSEADLADLMNGGTER
jgi:HK97 family phage prohead protease